MISGNRRGAVRFQIVGLLKTCLPLHPNWTKYGFRDIVVIFKSFAISVGSVWKESTKSVSTKMYPIMSSFFSAVNLIEFGSKNVLVKFWYDARGIFKCSKCSCFCRSQKWQRWEMYESMQASSPFSFWSCEKGKNNWLIFTEGQQITYINIELVWLQGTKDKDLNRCCYI